MGFRLRVMRGRAGRESPGLSERTGDQAEVSGHTSGPVGHNVSFQITGEARPRRRELRTAQMSVKGVRIRATPTRA